MQRREDAAGNNAGDRASPRDTLDDRLSKRSSIANKNLSEGTAALSLGTTVALLAAACVSGVEDGLGAGQRGGAAVFGINSSGAVVLTVSLGAAKAAHEVEPTATGDGTSHPVGGWAEADGITATAVGVVDTCAEYSSDAESGGVVCSMAGRVAMLATAGVENVSDAATVMWLCVTSFMGKNREEVAAIEPGVIVGWLVGGCAGTAMLPLWRVASSTVCAMAPVVKEGALLSKAEGSSGVVVGIGRCVLVTPLHSAGILVLDEKGSERGGGKG